MSRIKPIAERPKTLAALKASIEKWQKIVKTSNDYQDLDLGPETCPLCELFYRGFPKPCSSRCPVKIATGKDHCYGSPYAEVADADSQASFKIHAVRELEFLKSLLPSEDSTEQKS